MKKSIIAILTLAATCQVFAQTDTDSGVPVVEEQPVVQDSVAMFGVSLPEKSNLSEEASDLLASKMTQILGRCNAGAGGDLGAFVIEPTVNIGDKKQSEGMVQNVTVLGGELILSAKQRYTGQLFHSATFPLTATLKGSVTDEGEALVKSIKVSDAAYVRFVRNARKNILDYGLKHPEIWDVPNNDPEVVRDTTYVPVVIVVEKQTEPAPTQQPVQASQPSQPDQTAAQQPAASTPVAADIYISEPNWSAMVTECEFNQITRQIHIKMSVLNSNTKNYDNCFTRITKIIDINGAEHKASSIDSSYRNYPYDVPVTLNLYINDIYSNPGMIPFLELKIDNMKIELRNLMVK